MLRVQILGSTWVYWGRISMGMPGIYIFTSTPDKTEVWAPLLHNEAPHQGQGCFSLQATCGIVGTDIGKKAYMAFVETENVKERGLQLTGVGVGVFLSKSVL